MILIKLINNTFYRGISLTRKLSIHHLHDSRLHQRCLILKIIERTLCPLLRKSWIKNKIPTWAHPFFVTLISRSSNANCIVCIYKGKKFIRDLDVWVSSGKGTQIQIGILRMRDSINLVLMELCNWTVKFLQLQLFELNFPMFGEVRRKK